MMMMRYENMEKEYDVGEASDGEVEKELSGDGDV